MFGRKLGQLLIEELDREILKLKLGIHHWIVVFILQIMEACVNG